MSVKNEFYCAEHCLHYKACLYNSEYTPSPCSHFKGKADVIEVPEGGIGDLSDGYHTFNELYHHRAILFSVICNSMPEKAWKSKLHDTGDMYEGMFIVGIETPEGQATYHYDIEPYWDMFKVKELEKAPKWDGHTPQIALERLSKLSADVVEVVRCEKCKHLDIINSREVYAKCKMTDLEFKPFDIDTRKHYCSYGEKENKNATTELHNEG